MFTFRVNKIKETKNKIVYGQPDEEDTAPVIESLYLPKTLLGNPAPEFLCITIEKVEAD